MLGCELEDWQAPCLPQPLSGREKEGSCVREREVDRQVVGSLRLSKVRGNGPGPDHYCMCLRVFKLLLSRLSTAFRGQITARARVGTQLGREPEGKEAPKGESSARWKAKEG